MRKEMKHYLDLIPIYAKKRKRQSRMTRFCIILAVFLVASIFSMADMEIRSQIQRTVKDYGHWHAVFRNLDEEQIRMIEARPEVKTAAQYAVTNYRTDEGYTVNGKETAICGFDKSYQQIMEDAKPVEGYFPDNANEAMFTQNVKKQLGAEIGDDITLMMPDGNTVEFTVSGFMADTSMLASEDAFGIVLNIETFQKYFSDETQFYVQFIPYCNIQSTIDDICEQFDISPDDMQENDNLLALLFQTDDSIMRQLYSVAAILAVLVMAAGILMISSSINSNVSQRTQFFGMLRCLGADTRQVRRFVRREALSWCKSAIPIGLILSLLMVWALCALLRLLSPYYFGDMPFFGISILGLFTGAVVGMVTVILAARSPAKQASKVSPLTAVSGNAGTIHAVKRAADTRLFHIETALGVHHALGSKKNFVLMAGSFAFSIILFLSFSPAIDFMNKALRPLQPSAADLSIISPDKTCSISGEVMEQLKEMSAVDKVYGRSYAYSIPARVGDEKFTVQLISYEKNQFDWGKEELLEGSINDAEEGEGVLAVYMNTSQKFNIGDDLLLEFGDEEKTVKIVGCLAENMFDVTDESVNLICSEELFQKLTGESGYTIIDVQFNSQVTNQDVEDIRNIVEKGVTVSDNRIENEQVRGGYYSFALFLYGFLAVITLISVFNIINSINMSVSARIHEYGVMRAIGMKSSQTIRMVASEASSYVILGILSGSAIGLFLNYKVFEKLITVRWGTPWYFPVEALTVILVAVILAAVAAVRGPAKRIHEMSIVDTISAL